MTNAPDAEMAPILPVAVEAPTNVVDAPVVAFAAPSHDEDFHDHAYPQHLGGPEVPENIVMVFPHAREQVLAIYLRRLRAGSGVFTPVDRINFAYLLGARLRGWVAGNIFVELPHLSGPGIRKFFAVAAINTFRIYRTERAANARARYCRPWVKVVSFATMAELAACMMGCGRSRFRQPTDYELPKWGAETYWKITCEADSSSD